MNGLLAIYCYVKQSQSFFVLVSSAVDVYVMNLHENKHRKYVRFSIVKVSCTVCVIFAYGEGCT